MGSRSLERSHHRVIAYDARGHGRSSPAPTPEAYGYDELTRDLEAVMNALRIEQAVLAGASMGAHTLLAFALQAPERVAGLVVATPAYDGRAALSPERLARWDALADGLATGGVEGFIAAYGTPRTAPEFRDIVLQVIRQRLSLHEHPEALADAIRAVPRSRPFDEVASLAAIDVPVTIVASSDEADPEHPRAVAADYAAAIPGAELLDDEPGRSPRAWQGSQLSQVIADVVRRAGL
jgi:pimeloyl-ACP methyl ester carboxylesterase